MDNNLFIEETLPASDYKVIWRGTKGIQDINEALTRLKSYPTSNRLELWSKAHASSPKGFAPIAFREQDGREVRISNTLKMLMGIS